VVLSTLTTFVESLYKDQALHFGSNTCWQPALCSMDVRRMLCSSALRTDCGRQSTSRLRFGSIVPHDIDQLRSTIWHTPMHPSGIRECGVRSRVRASDYLVARVKSSVDVDIMDRS
jgi:hypothetical protein